MALDDYEKYYDPLDDYNPVAEHQDSLIRNYYNSYGKKINIKILKCLQEARELFFKDYFGPSLVLNVTAIEIIIRDFLILPIIQGAIPNEEWAGILIERLIPSRSTSKQRELVPTLFSLYNINITKIKMWNERNLWGTLHGEVIKTRNLYVHDGIDVDKATAKLSYDCAYSLLESVADVTKRYKFNIELPIKYLCEK